MDNWASFETLKILHSFPDSEQIGAYISQRNRKNMNMLGAVLILN